jgi:hypothetical protein
MPSSNFTPLTNYNYELSDYSSYISSVSTNAIISTSNGYDIYEFDSSGSFDISGNTEPVVLFVFLAGGGGGGGDCSGNTHAGIGGGGGGGGGFLEKAVIIPANRSYTFNINIGQGGQGGSGKVGSPGNNGNPTSITFNDSNQYSIVVPGGGGGGGGNLYWTSTSHGPPPNFNNGRNGGSGGGGGSYYKSTSFINTIYPGTGVLLYGNSGGGGTYGTYAGAGGGGGGAGGNGGAGVGNNTGSGIIHSYGLGGAGLKLSFPGLSTYNSTLYCYGGNGNYGQSGATVANGLTNTGGGGQGGFSWVTSSVTYNYVAGGSGGSGVVIVAVSNQTNYVDSGYIFSDSYNLIDNPFNNTVTFDTSGNNASGTDISGNCQLASIGNTAVSTFTNSIIYNNISYNQVPINNGVFMMNTGTASLNIIPSSITSLSVLSIGDCDDWWLVYPGFSIQLFYSTGYAGTNSNVLVNDTNSPVVFATGSPSLTTYISVYQYNSSNDYGTNKTDSVLVWYQGVQVTIPALS